ncbi:MAG: lipopolysaccharide heptosyltransferase I [Burkholderiaceae bacterium]
MKLALIKTSSMGDVIHALPVVSDLLRARPGLRIDWLVEEAFAALPALHPGVGEVIPVAVRRWRKSPFSAATRREVGALRTRLRAQRYTLALDLQGLLKSAWVARMTGAPIAGFSRVCVREPLAALAYRHRFDVDTGLHAIERLRALAGQALDYPVEGLPVFSLTAPAVTVPGLPGDQPYALLLHATSRAEKQWPQDHWQSLIGALAAQGLASVLPWGSAAERARAEQLAGTSGGIVLPRLDLRQCAAAIGGARLVVGVDTGLTHLAAALDVPTVALFAATPAERFGPYWTPRALSLGAAGCWPEPAEVLDAAARVMAAGPSAS